jgi:hypothetical protein
MPLQATSGAASYDGFGGGVPVVPNYIEDVFSTYLYTGNGSTQTITNGIDLSTKGGLVWLKGRSNAQYHNLIDTARGATKVLQSDDTAAQYTQANGLTAFNAAGFSIGNDSAINFNNYTYVSWTFRKQAKFYTQGTYTGTGSTQTITHDLGTTPGFIIIKGMGNSYAWVCYHRSLGATKFLALNSTQAAITTSTPFNNSEPTSTTFTVGTSNAVNESGQSFVYYAFAHDAGGFGLTGTDNVISCGTWTGTGSNLNVNLGYEPQWLMFKRTDADGDWIIVDNMRGFTADGADAYLRPNTSGAETNPTGAPALNSTGFGWTTGSGTPYIYIAIRRGPMKVPTSGASVYNAVARTGTSTTATITAGFAYDWLIAGIRNLAYGSKNWDRVRGIKNPLLRTVDTASEYTGSVNSITGGTQDGLTVGADDDWTINYNAANYINWFFKRAPSVFDIVCYTGVNPNGNVNLTINHNLGVRPEIIIIKRRSTAASNNNWYTGWNMQDVNGSNQPIYMEVFLNGNSNGVSYIYPNWFTSAPTATTFEISYQGGNVNQNGATYVAYLFATCPGVSKVGSYTGTGALQTINCGFTTGARFVLIKRTDSTGDWYVYDSTRGITSGNDPYYLLNLNDAEVTNTSYVDTDSTGFKVTAAAPAALNASGGNYIFLAIA